MNVSFSAVGEHIGSRNITVVFVVALDEMCIRDRLSTANKRTRISTGMVTMLKTSIAKKVSVTSRACSMIIYIGIVEKSKLDNRVNLTREH